jgi:hypothetical protein
MKDFGPSFAIICVLAFLAAGFFGDLIDQLSGKHLRQQQNSNHVPQIVRRGMPERR